MNKANKRIRDFIIMVVIPALIGLAIALAASAQPARAQSTAQTQGPVAAQTQTQDAPIAGAPQGVRKVVARCALVIDADSGAPIFRNGDCHVRRGPESTFKLPLAVMGFDSGVLVDAHTPAIAFDGRFKAPQRDHKTVDPSIWERDSVVWYSRELLRRMAERDGQDVLARWVKKLGYGNADASGDPGKNNGLTNAWLNSSLAISPEEQTAFLRLLLRDELPASARAQALTRAIVPSFEGQDGWTVYGKTGSTGRLTAQGPKGPVVEERGWFVGWAEKSGRRVIFAVHEHDRGGRDDGTYAGPRVRDWTLRQFNNLATPPGSRAAGETPARR